MENQFIPPFCPNPDCTEHQRGPTDYRKWWNGRGWYHTKTLGAVRRFKCTVCGKSFTERIFHLDYYAKRTDIDFFDILFHYCNGFSQRAMAQHFHCTTRTIAQRLQIVSRQAMAAIIDANGQIKLSEDIAIDGMQNFTGSQYQPNNYNIVVGQYSQYLGMVTQVIFRRAGRMTTYQKARRTHFDAIGYWERGAFTKSIRELVAHIARITVDRAQSEQIVVCNSDNKKMYQNELLRNRELSLLMEEHLFIHRITSSRRFRNIKNPLFPVNYFDSRLRNDLADWQRETTSFPREANRNFQRFLCYAAYHNFFKPHRVRSDSHSHAEAAGLPKADAERIKASFFRDRAFRTRLELPPQWNDCWFCKLITPLQIRNRKPFNGNRRPAYLAL